MTDYNLSDIAAVTGGNNRGCGMFGDDSWAWIVILLLFGYGGNGFGGNGRTPCATQSDVRSAVDQQTLISKLDQQTYGIADSTYALNNAITSGFHGVDTAICNLGYNLQNGMNGISREISDCCCSTKQAICDVNYNLATQGCAIQNTIQNTTRDIIDNANANSRAILDALNANYIRTLEQENNSLRLSASQTAQNAYLISQLKPPCPVPAYNVPNPNYPIGC